MMSFKSCQHGTVRIDRCLVTARTQRCSYRFPKSVYEYLQTLLNQADMMFGYVLSLHIVAKNRALAGERHATGDLNQADSVGKVSTFDIFSLSRVRDFKA